jgi:hypothetical protein
MSNILNTIKLVEAKRSPEPDYNDPSWDEKVQNIGQKAKQAELLKSKGKEPRTRWNPETKKYYVDFSDQVDEAEEPSALATTGSPLKFIKQSAGKLKPKYKMELINLLKLSLKPKQTAVAESLGTPYPGTYEQTNDMFKSHGAKRTGTLTTEQGVAESDLDKYKKYTRPVVKTTPKIERTTNPSGRSTDHVEWIVTSDTGEKKRFTSKRLAQEYYNMCTKQSVAEEQHSCPHCGGEMVSEELMNEKKDACYYKVKSRYSVWPSAYASGALVKCRKKGADSWGNGGKKNESSILEGMDQVDESLHDWFNKEKWVRMDTKGNIKGPCAKEPGEGKPKCLPQAKAHSLGKKGRASAAARKRREDPNPDRSGKAINVDTKKESAMLQGLTQVDEGWKSALGSAALAGAMAMGGGHAQAADLSQYATGYLQKVASGEGGRAMVSIDDAKAELQARVNGKQQTTAPARIDSPSGSSGFSKEYLQRAADPQRVGRYLLSVEKAQELLQGQQ